MNPFFLPAEICLPRTGVSSSWCVVACDQYTSQPEYWEETKKIVGQDPSTLHMIFPEVYLEDRGVSERIEQINQTMLQYRQTILQTLPLGYVYVERVLHDGKIRRGLMGLIDLEQYDFQKGAQSAIRATEGTVLSRIPPRVRIREHATLELPHVMLLFDDPNDTMFSALNAQKEEMRVLYDTPLMQNGGHITGRMLTHAQWDLVDQTMLKLGDARIYSKRYQSSLHDKPMVFAVGDGNHSLATAKQCYENLKQRLTPQEAQNHPARYALTELVNIHDASLEFEPIYRVLFHVKPQELLQAWQAYAPGIMTDVKTKPNTPGHSFEMWHNGQCTSLFLPRPTAQLPVASLQSFLDAYLQQRPDVRLDYIHGVDAVQNLCQDEDTVGFLFDGMKKSELFLSVIKDGALPRKTFSMGHANDKRYYLECRSIV